jgi:hypothetical protein
MSVVTHVVSLNYLTHRNPEVVPLHGKNASLLSIEIRTIRCTAPFYDTTPGIITGGNITVEISLTN